jgi:hypothetical protein
LPVCLSRTLTLLATHSLACCDKGRQDQQTLLSPPRPNAEQRDELSRPLCAALDTTTTRTPRPTTTVFFEPTQPDPNTRSPPPIKEQARKKPAGQYWSPTTHFLPTLYSFQAGDQAQVATACAKGPSSRLPSLRPHSCQLGPPDFPHAASVGNLGPRHTDGKSHRDKGSPRRRPRPSLSESRPGRHALTLPRSHLSSPRPRPITSPSRDRLQVLKGVR